MEKKFCTNEEFAAFMADSGTRIVADIWHKYGKGLDFDDFLQESSIVIARALALWQPGSGTKKGTYVYGCVLKVPKMLHRSQCCMSRGGGVRPDSLDNIGYNIKTTDDSWEDRLLDKIEKHERSEKLWHAIHMAGLTEDELLVIRLLLEDRSQEEIGRRLGMGQANVSKLRSRALTKLREALLACGWKEPED